MKIKEKYVITVSYGDYTEGSGGTDKVLLSHQKIFNDAGISVVHLFGNHSRLSDRRSDLWNILVDGVYKGIYSTEQICHKLHSFQRSGAVLQGMFIHHFRGVEIEELAEILRFTSCGAFFYIHDFQSICPKCGMFNENNCFCGKELHDFAKCCDCIYYDEKRLSDIRYFFSRNYELICCIAPSETAKEIWLTAFPEFTNKVIVLSHQKLIGEYTENLDPISESESLKICFIGARHIKKGWFVWENAVSRVSQLSHNEEFYHLGNADLYDNLIKGILTDFHEKDDAAIKLLRSKRIHVAVLWSLLPETYSYTFFEALASNCFILTNYESGNIAVQTQTHNNGILCDADDLFTLLNDEEMLRDEVNHFRKSKRYGPEFLIDNDDILQLLSNDCDSLKFMQIKDINLFDRILIRAYSFLYVLNKKRISRINR